MEGVAEKQKITNIVSAFSINLICFINRKCPVKL